MGDVTLYYDPVFVEHRTGYGHPERPERLTAAMKALEGSGVLDEVEVRSPRNATPEEVQLVHGSSYYEQVRRVAGSGGGNLDMDTALSGASFDAALKAAGAMVESVDRCVEGDIRSSFCLVRPPGHHALPSRGMGFCLFNNVAVGARHALSVKGVERVMIVDWDAHHGNGTQDIFYEDPSVLYASIHQYPHYPGSGSVAETGSGPGRGTTINIPFPPGTGESLYLEALESIIIPAGREFAPDLLLVSAGYDCHVDDLLCQMRLVEGSFHRMTEMLGELAEDCCRGGMIATLEGGYNLDAQAGSLVQTVSALAGMEAGTAGGQPPETAYPDRAAEVIARALEARREAAG